MSVRIAAAALFAISVTAALFSAPAGQASAASKCKNVRGHVTSHTVTENCPFLIFYTNSMLLIVTAAFLKFLKPSIG